MLDNIKNIVFDVGEVLVNFRYMDYMHEDLGFSDEVTELFAKNIILSEYWDMLDKGDITLEEARDHYMEVYPQYAEELYSFWKNLDGIVREYDYAYELIKGLKDRGFGVYLLSNYPDQLSDMHWSKFTFMDILDGYLISAKEHMVKPHPEFYKLLESRFGLNLEECIFVDDRTVNVEAAEALGMKGIIFKGYKELIESFQNDVYSSRGSLRSE